MIAIANGISLHGGFLPYISTFLMFVEYAHNAVRMAALMKQRQVMVIPTTPSVWVKTARLRSSSPVRIWRSRSVLKSRCPRQKRCCNHVFIAIND